MTFVLPIPLPASLTTERRVIPKNDFAHAHYTVGFGPDGRGYVHSDLFYNYYRYDQGDADLSATLVTHLSPDFSITGLTWLEDLHREMKMAPDHAGVETHLFNNSIQPLAVTNRGEVVFTTQMNRTFVYDADVRRVARFDPKRGEADGFSDVVVVDGGFVAMRDREVINIAENPPPLRDGLPALREVGTVTQSVGERGFRGYLGRFAALDLDRILIARFVHRGRSGWIDNAAFDFAVIAGDGSVVGRFPLGAADTPYGKTGTHDDSYVAHRPLRVWLTRSDAALHVFDRDGGRLLRIGLAEEERFAAIVPLTLLSVGPGGQLIFVSKKHHLLVVTDPIESVASIEAALVDVGAVYASELARLKKAVPYDGGRWFGFEATTPRAVAKAVAKKSKKPPKPTVPDPEPVPPPVARTPGEAVSLAPDDIDVLSVYADSLAETDPTLSEYINVSIRLHRTPADHPERDDIAERAHSLRRAHGKKWFATWNTPTKLFDPARFDEFCGLPRSVSLDGIPADLPALDRQVANLPIQTLGVSGVSTRELAKLGELVTLRRVSQLVLSGDSKHKLAKPALAWIAKEQLANLKKLNMYSVTVTGTGLADVVDTMPHLVELAAGTGQLSSEGLAVLADTSAAARIEKMYLSYNPLGSSSAAMFARFGKLQQLEISSVDLGDDIAATKPPQMSITKLEIDDNPRLGAKGLAWIVEAMPGLRTIRLPRAAPPQAMLALAPIAAQLEAIDASWMEEPTKAQLIETVIPHARALKKLRLYGNGVGLARRIVEHTTPEVLELGHVNDDDVAAVAELQSLRELNLGEGANDDNIVPLTRSPDLGKLRTLHVHSHGLTETGIAGILEAKFRLSSLHLMYAQIRDASVLRVIRDRPFTLRLFRCEVPRGQLDYMRREWGDRLLT